MKLHLPKKVNKKVVLSAVAGGVLAAGALTTGLVYAQTNNTNPDNAFLTRVAQILGIDKSKVQSAVSQASNEKIDQMLKDGKITQAQADKMKQAVTNGDYFEGFHDERGELGRMGEKSLLNKLASFLGVNVTDLKADLDNNLKPSDIVTKDGKKVADAQSYIVTQETKNIQTMVSSKEITQAQADKMIANLSQRVTNFLNGVKPQRPMGNMPQHNL